MVLWAYRTTHKTATGNSSFTLAYGAEAMILVEAQIPTHRAKNYDPEVNKELLNASLDLVDKPRDEAQLRVIDYQRRIARQYNRKVKNRRFEVGDFVLKRVFPPPGAFGPNREESYAIKDRLGDGTFKLITVEETQSREHGIANTCDAISLRHKIRHFISTDLFSFM